MLIGMSSLDPVMGERLRGMNDESRSRFVSCEGLTEGDAPIPPSC